MGVEEYSKIFASLGRAPYWATISGGEPFLRPDLAEICQALYNYCRPSIINIPTNGLLLDRIPNVVEDIVRNCPESQIIINLSLDGVGEEHDQIRQIKGNFQKALSTYNALKSLEFKNLTIGIHTVISKYNVERLPEIYHELQQLAPDSYITEVAEERVELGTIGTNITPDPEQYAQAIDFLSSQIKRQHFSGISRITQSFRLQYYEMVKRILKEQRGLIPCYAGFISTQISPEGNVWPCCIRAEVMGNLPEADYQFPKVWFSPQAEKLRARIKQRNCFCPLANAAYTNLLCNTASLIRAAYWSLKLGAR